MPFYQDAEAKLTLTRVATAPVLVAEIAKATGQRLEVSPTLGMEVLMVSVEGVRAGDVLAKLAIAATAVWQPMEGGYRLVPDNAARGIEASTERARRAQAINEGVKKRLAAAASAKGDEMGFGTMMSNRSVDAFVPMLEVGALAAMEEGDRIVFATSPTAVQRPLRGNAMPIVAQLIGKHNEQAKKMAGQMDEVPEAFSSFMSGPIGERIKQMGRPVTGTPTKVIVVASKGGVPFLGGDGLDIRIEARVYGADGKVLIQETGTLDSDMMSRIMAMVGKKPAAVGTEKTIPILYSPEAKALAESSAMPSMEMGMGVGAFEKKSSTSPALRTFLMAPERNEPLALVPGEGLAALAKARRKPLVACIPDGAYPAMLGSTAPKTVEELEKGFISGTMRLVPDTTFYVVKASDPDQSRRNRLDRYALANLLRAVSDHQTPTLSELAAFAARTPDPGQNRLSQAILGVFVPSSLGSMTGMVSWPSLRLYDALAPAQRQSLESGAQLPFNTLSPAAKASLRTMLYGAAGRLSSDGAPLEDDPVSLGMRMALGGGSTSAGEEPTEVAPDGLPAGGYLQASVTSESIIRPVTAEGPSASILGTDELAMMRLMGTSPMAGQMGDSIKLPENGILGSRKAWKIRGYVATGTYVSASLDDDNAPKSGRTVRLNDLPADVQAQVLKRVEQLKKSPLGAILSMDPSLFGGPKAKP